MVVGQFLALVSLSYMCILLISTDEETNLAAVGGAAAGGVGLAVITIILVIFLRRYKIQGQYFYQAEC